jgi:hypothetical protein
MDGYESKNKEEIHKELQDIYPIGSPHIEEKVIGGNVDLDLLSPFPQKDARIMGGMGRKGKLFKVNNGGKRKWKSQHPNKEEGALYSPRMKSDRYRNFNPEIPALGAEFPARGQNFCPPYKISAPLTEGCTRAREKGLSEISQGQKLWNFRPLEIPASGAEFPAREKTSIRKRL